MVDQLHRHGIEVVLDVVYNHTAEGGATGPTLSWRGLDNASTYALDGAGQYLNFTGCGNALNAGEPRMVQFVMDSLRWWVQAFGVDGFRFDLAATLGRDPALHHHFNPRAALFTAMAQDPVLARVKRIAEPWDVAPGGYQVGAFRVGLAGVERPVPRHCAHVLARARLHAGPDGAAHDGLGRPVRRRRAQPARRAST